MCLLTYFPPGTQPDRRALQTGAAVNPHGHGYALIIEDKIRVGHSMDPDPLIEEFLNLRAEYPTGAGLFHSRYATRGIQALKNCHPFPLGRDTRTVIAHNGTLPKRVHPRAYDQRSDTRIAAEEYLPRHPFGSIDTHRGARGLASWLGTSKLVILTVDPTYARRAYILNAEAGIWDDEIWYSNSTYQPCVRRFHILRCDECGQLDLHRAAHWCDRREWCFDCWRSFPRCICTTHPRTTAPVTPVTRAETLATLTRPTRGRHRARGPHSWTVEPIMPHINKD
ncbi:class II glutamine amidotransferase [Nocardia sp. CNY236]|uniref:class II glutamine amidotransferase n=1 Tax=Nocardia sp. CNY236 TaxID=1169152 RepID=UPI0004168AA3|nr:class II glutamine amidotransferase [Nocardia sp. CNY236]